MCNSFLSFIKYILKSTGNKWINIYLKKERKGLSVFFMKEALVFFVYKKSAKDKKGEILA